jgi:hypothetical protein
MIFGPIFALLAIVGIVAIFIWMVQLFVRVLHLVRDYERRHMPADASRELGERPLDMLARRCAAGEIDADEFEERHRLLVFGHRGAARSTIARQSLPTPSEPKAPATVKHGRAQSIQIEESFVPKT